MVMNFKVERECSLEGKTIKLVSYRNEQRYGVRTQYEVIVNGKPTHSDPLDCFDEVLGRYNFYVNEIALKEA